MFLLFSIFPPSTSLCTSVPSIEKEQAHTRSSSAAVPAVQAPEKPLEDAAVRSLTIFIKPLLRGATRTSIRPRNISETAGVGGVFTKYSVGKGAPWRITDTGSRRGRRGGVAAGGEPKYLPLG